MASNLGVVELTVAIHRVFDTETDRLVFDVGHQAYVHKILTGRADKFDGLRTFGGMAGFPKPSESIHDAFIAGHASNSVSVALGMARARTLQGQNHQVLALLGDGAMTGGLAYEGLNDAGASGVPMIVILNDNGMSISPNVGGISNHLKKIRSKPGYFGIKRAYRKTMYALPGGRKAYDVSKRCKDFLKRHLVGLTLFEKMGFSYIGPIDGSNLSRLTDLLQYAKDMTTPVVVHVKTHKGAGYPPAEENPGSYHGVGKFDAKKGLSPSSGQPTFSGTFGKTLCCLASQDEKICAVTAAMIPGTGLDGFAKRFPERTFDVGIAEGHAVCMAAGLAKSGMVPVVPMYSTFLQRAYDMMFHDVALLNLHVVFCVDRAGLVGEDGETHHGVFDVGYLRQVPGMALYAPANQVELTSMLETAIYEETGPVAVRYPRGGDGKYQEMATQPVVAQGSDITLVTYGTLVNQALEAREILAGKASVEVVKLGKIAPLDMTPILESCRKTKAIFVAEEVASCGCLAREIFENLSKSGINIPMESQNVGGFVTHGKRDILLEQCSLDGNSLAKSLLEVLS